MKRLLFTVLTVLIGAGIVAGSVWLLMDRQAAPATLKAKIVGTAATPQGNLPHATLDLSIYPQSSASVPGPDTGVNAVIDKFGWPFYWPSTSLELPAHSLVTITVHQYDGASTVWNPYFAKVHGTVGGTASFNGKTKTEIDPANVAHTFTIHQYPQSTQPYFFVSVPMLAVADNAKNEANGYPKAEVMEFSFITGAPGDYIWNCEDPCGSGYVDFGAVMSERGWMSGTVTVV
ncbi:MAG: hypothetical protein WC005_01485 [Candidatus Nanopelagicales bacterium]